MIYLDHAATTPICDAAKKVIIEHLDDFGNPSSAHSIGHKALMLIEDARERIAKCINAEPDQIYFTSGGSEADTMALNWMVTLASNLEHHAICPQGYFKACRSGIVNLNSIIKEIERQNMLVEQNDINAPYDMISCMTVNNEIGTIQPIKLVAEIAHDNGLFFHTDAVQAVGHIPVDVKDFRCEMLSVSGHKFGAPKGIGFLYMEQPHMCDPIIYGGKQEQGLRGGTENVLGIVSMAAALEDSITHMEERNVYIKELRDQLLSELLSIDGINLNGSLDNRVVSNINVRIDGIKGQELVAMADQYGICISAGSACNEGNPQPSHVLKAIGLTDEEALSSIRITLGHENTLEEIDYVCRTLPKLIARLRAI